MPAAEMWGTPWWIALDGDRRGDGDGAAVAVELRELRLHGAAEPERAGARGQRDQDEHRQTDAQQAEEPAGSFLSIGVSQLASQNGLSMRCIGHSGLASLLRRHTDTIS